MKRELQKPYVILYFVLLAVVTAMILYPVFAHAPTGGGPESSRAAAAHRRAQNR